MADEYFDPDVIASSQELADLQFEHMEEGFPGWVPAAGNLDTWILEGGARMGSELASLLLMVPPELFAVFGEKIAQVPRQEPTQASATSTWTLGDLDGHTIEEGTTLSVDGAAFEVAGEVVVPAGQDTANEVSIIAVDAGAQGNGMLAPVALEEATDYAAVIVLDAPTQGGRDAEDITEYNDKLARRQRLAAPRPLNAEDVELFAQDIPGVDRVAVLDNYRPASAPLGEGFNIPLTFTMAPIDSAGQPAAAAADLLAAIKIARGTNWDIYSIVPDYTVIDVNVEGVAMPGWDPATVQALVLDVLTNFLSPQNWGLPQFGEQKLWINTPEVRYREVSAVVENALGFDYSTLVEFNVQGVPLVENQDVSLGAGPVRLPLPGDITATVVAP